MAGEITITIMGNLTADPELRETQGGVKVASYTVASTPRRYDSNSGRWEDGPTTFMRCSEWRESGVNTFESARKGDRVIVCGTLTPNEYTDREGIERRDLQLTVVECGVSTKYAQVHDLVKVKPQQQQQDRPRGGSSGGGQARGRGSSGGQQRSGGRQQQGEQYDDPWGSAPPAGDSRGQYDDDEPPF